MAKVGTRGEGRESWNVSPLLSEMSQGSVDDVRDPQCWRPKKGAFGREPVCDACSRVASESHKFSGLLWHAAVTRVLQGAAL